MATVPKKELTETQKKAKAKAAKARKAKAAKVANEARTAPKTTLKAAPGMRIVLKANGDKEIHF